MAMLLNAIQIYPAISKMLSDWNGGDAGDRERIMRHKLDDLNDSLNRIMEKYPTTVTCDVGTQTDSVEPRSPQPIEEWSPSVGKLLPDRRGSFTGGTSPQIGKFQVQRLSRRELSLTNKETPRDWITMVSSVRLDDKNIPN